MYSFEARIRYSETDITGKLSLEALLDYFQDCSTFHSQDLGLGLEYLTEKHLVWVLSSWQIIVNRYPECCEKVVVGTFPTEFKGCFGYRNFFLKDMDGNYLAIANTMWTLLDTDNFRPSKPTAEMLKRYELTPCIEADWAPRKIAVPEGGCELEGIQVKKHHLDTNQHVNNGQYVKMAEEFLPEGFEIAQLRAEYKKQAYLNDVLIPYVVEVPRETSIKEEACESANAEKIVVALKGEDGAVYVNVEFTRK